MFPSLYGDPAAYDRIHPVEADEVLFWADRLGDAPGPVLELGCGTGSFALPYARAGYAVTGLDLEPKMLAEAERKAAQQGLTVRWQNGDMRSFSLGERFGAIQILGNSLAHLQTDADLAATLRAVREHLAPEGLFGIDLEAPEAGKLTKPTSDFTVFANYNDPVTERPVELVYRAFYSVASRIRRLEVFEKFGPFSARPVARLDLRVYRTEDLVQSLEREGFEVVESCGDYQGGAPRPDSPRQLLCAVARAAA